MLFSLIPIVKKLKSIVPQFPDLEHPVLLSSPKETGEERYPVEICKYLRDLVAKLHMKM